MGSTELTHHGVKGMKWGRRKARDPDAEDAADKLVNSNIKQPGTAPEFSAPESEPGIGDMSISDYTNS